MSTKQALTFSTEKMPTTVIGSGIKMKVMAENGPLYFNTAALNALNPTDKTGIAKQASEILSAHLESLKTLPFFAFKMPNDLYFENAPKMRPRSEVETDTDSLHYIPYVIVADKNTGKLLSYLRGKAGDETRLHDLRSIGWGGHVDSYPEGVSGIKSREDLVAALMHTVAVELWEELGYKLSEKEIEKLTNQLEITLPTETEKERLSKKYPIRVGLYDPTNAVGRTHLGVMFYLEIDAEKTAFVFEEGTVLDIQWDHPGDMLTRVFREEYQLEGWSMGALAYMYPSEFLHYSMMKSTMRPSATKTDTL